MKNKILLVEDDDLVAEVVNFSLKWDGFQLETVTDGMSALRIALDKPPALVILDIALPNMDRVEVCRRLRKASNTATVPIIMLTARGSEIDKEVGLDAGADDYITKPFERHELLARVRALLRRTQYLPSQRSTAQDDAEPVFVPKLTVEPLQIDVAGRQVMCRGQRLELSYRQFELLVYLARNHGIVLTRDQLLQRVWGYDYMGDARTLDVHIRWLREKIEEDLKNPRHIQTVRGVGYCYRE